MHNNRAEEIPGEIGLGLLLRRANRAFSTEIARRLSDLGISHAQFHHLRRLAEHDGISSSELSALVEVKKATSTSILDALEGKGLIRRERDTVDRRRVNVFLTPEGWSIQPGLRDCAVEANVAASRQLAPAEREALFDLLHRTIAGLSESRDGEG